MSHSLRVFHYQLGWKQTPEERREVEGEGEGGERRGEGGGVGKMEGGNKAGERVLMNKSWKKNDNSFR